MKTLTATILSLLLCSQVFATITIPNDSLVSQNDSNKKFLEHKVSSDETLYSLLRKYNCTADEVFSANPSLHGSSNIYVNQIIKFPTAVPNTSIVSSRKASEVNTEGEISTVHHVRAKETLYSISKQYNVDIEKLKSINKIQENEISIGQTLIIRSSLKNYEEHIAKSVSSRFPDNKIPEKFVVPNAPMGEKISEIGIAELISTDRSSTRMLALHKTAPLGSLMTVKNEATGDRIVVKVIGKLPDTGNNANTIVRLSPTAFYKLNPKDIKFRAEVAYFVAPNVN
ncbi:LysM peptidoglycan-binding domain-containing protein [uncultured Arcticibacterium sp.]|uniref:septal ring lytic transglycosylase RlpA family protein n=1 Tax=uncultured Arcticibacterium sp. TaxID=2173042 RepID=UPI0030FA1367